MNPETIGLLFIVGIILFFIFLAIIANALNNIADYSKIVEKQRVTYDGKVLSSTYIPMRRGLFKRWYRVYIPSLKYSTSKYCAPLYRRNACNNFNLTVDILNTGDIEYKDYKLNPIIAYSLAKQEDMVIYYCSKLKAKNGAYRILGTESECKLIIDALTNSGFNSHTVEFEHQPIRRV